MLRWFTGEARSAGADKPAYNEQTSLEEPPDTPAPLFAVRAFKTAIFGTPHPYSNIGNTNDQRLPEEKVSGALTAGHKNFLVGDVGSNISIKSKLEPFSSPTKGILLTPGTGAARRKSVSFGALAKNRYNDGQEQAQRIGGPGTSSGDIPNALISNEACARDRRSAPLSRTLFKSKSEAADQLHAANQGPARSAPSPQETGILDSQKDVTQTEQGVEYTDGDITFDLDTPRSKSGKHWKAEYEKYSRRSDREMKRVIQLSQTAKSYAAKKDVEAANLGEILNQELSRTAAIEANVSAVAKELAKHAAQGLGGNPDEQKLVSDLAKQTALALRYKHKADRCRTALNRQSRSTAVNHYADSNAVDCMESTGTQNKASNTKITTDHTQDSSCLQTDLHNMVERAEKAEVKATGLAKENLALKANLARVKEETEAKLKLQKDHYKVQIMRLRTENQSLRHAATLKADRFLAHSSTHPLALQSSVPTSDSREKILECPQPADLKDPSLQARLAGSNTYKINVEELVKGSQSQETMRRSTELSSEDQSATTTTPAKHSTFTTPQAEGFQGSGKSPRRKAPKPTLDIWTMDDELDSPRTGMVSHQALLDDSSNEAGIVKLSKETDDALREISRSVIEEQQNSSERSSNRSPNKTPVSVNLIDHLKTTSPKASSLDIPETSTGSAARRMRERRSTINSPRPSMLSFVASLENEPGTDQPPIGPIFTNPRPPQKTTNNTRRQTGSVLASTRVNSMGTARSHTVLTADRIHAAKLRLANKRRLQENYKAEE